jgi:iron complex transport system substrate-binding protein
MRPNGPLPLRKGLGVVVAIASLGIAEVDAGDGISFVDQNGRTIELSKPVERVITIPKPAPAMFVAVDGSSSKLVGVHPESKTALLEGILGRFFPEMKDISTSVVADGFAPNVEEVLRLDPDLVFQWGMDQDMISPMERVGLQVAALQYDGASDLTVGWLEMMGAAVDRTEKVERLIGWREAVRKDIEDRVAAIPTDQRPRVLYFRSYLNDYQVQVLYNMVLLGAINPSLEGRPFDWRSMTVNAEQVLAWDPDIILLNGFEEALTPDDVYANPVFAGLSAVRNKRVYKMPLGGYRWDPSSHESPLGWMWLSMVFYPDQFDWPLRTIIGEKYQEIYGQTPNADEIDGILRVSMNGDSANYEPFKQ